MDVDGDDGPPGLLDVTQSWMPAGFWIRAAARILDWGVLGVLGLVTGMVMIFVAWMIEGASGHPAAPFIASMERTTLIGWIGSTIATMAYHACFEGTAGSTIGKRLLQLQVMSVTGQPIGFMQGVKRSVAFVVDALFFGAIGGQAMAESPEKRRIGDNWAGTRVVRRRSLPRELQTRRWQMVAGFVLAAEVATLWIVLTQLAEYFWFVQGT
ncbi:MAG TPA: RDD family protein [Thermoanaerobaculia bacterium]|jgi:uncharacterized RDD family membrane protein YckC